MDDSDLTTVMLRELGVMLQPLVEAVKTPERLLGLMAQIGWSLHEVASEAPMLAQEIGSVVEWVDAARALADGDTPTSEQLADVLDQLSHIPITLGALPARLGAVVPSASAALQTLPLDLLEWLFLDWFRGRAPAAHALATAMGVIEEEQLVELVDPVTGAVLRSAAVVERLRSDTLGRWFTRPRAMAEEAFGLTGLSTMDDADAYARRVFPLLALVARPFGVEATLGRGPGRARLSAADERAVAHLLQLVWRLPWGDSANGLVRLGVMAIAAAEGGPALALLPSGSLDVGLATGPWSGRVRFEAGAASLLLRTGSIEAGRDERFEGSAKLAWLASKSRLGVAGTGLQLGELSIEAGFSLSEQVRDVAIEAAFDRAQLIVAPPSTDGFLSKVMPTKGMAIDFDLGLGWSLSKGLRFKGSAGTQLESPINVDLGGVVQAKIFWLTLRASADDGLPTIRASAAVALALTLGPLRAQVDRIGVAFGLSFPPQGGQIGPLRAEVGFKPPHGIGLSIDASLVKGGGFIGLDLERQQYSGVLQLAIQKTIDVKAIGLLNARLPEGRPGFSLLIIITAQFPPVQLGMGFTLNGLGGLAGINRTSAVDVLRAGLRNGALDSILFPPDPLANVPALLATLSSVFPVAEGRHVFGPMVRIGYGSPTLLTLDVAVLIELPDPVRIILLGRLKATLPDEKKPAAVIRMDALGVLDFGRKELSLDATIYDSKILTFTLSGDMAMRLSWGDAPGFLLSVGGFHPHFQAPAGMPALRRLAISLLDLEDNDVVARIRLEAYLAITSNTLQFGSLVQAYVKALGFEVQGLLGFDALIHFPFAIEAQMVAAVSLSFNGAMLMGADVVVDLSGPAPWHLVGQARFVFLGQKASVPIDFTVGAAGVEVYELPPPADVAALLATSLGDVRNWQATRAESLPAVGRLRPAPLAPGPFLLIHPDAGLAVRQRVAPLNATITRFGNAPIQGGASRFTLQLGAADAVAQPLREPFAMAQFQAMNDDEKLSRPSFELLEAGLQLEAAGFAFAADAVIIAPLVTVESRLVDLTTRTAVSRVPDSPGARRKPGSLSKAELKLRAYFSSRGAPASSATARQGQQRYRPPPVA